MIVIKRGGRRERVAFDKIQRRIRRLCYGLDERYVDDTLIAQKTCQGVYNGVTTEKLDELAAQFAAQLTSEHHSYGILAGRLCVSNLQKNVKKSFRAAMQSLHDYVEPKTKSPAPLLDSKIMDIIVRNEEHIEAAIVHDRDFDFDYFGFKTLEHGYLLKLNDRIGERVQHSYMRVALGIHQENIEDALKSYHYMSERYYTHASPTLFNSGTCRPSLSSCFLLTMMDDSIEGIYDTLKRCAQISKGAGGIGIAISNIRATGTYIAGTNGKSNGIVPMLRVFNATAKYVDQGGGKRKGAFAVYLEPWHADVFAFLDLRKNTGVEDERCRDLFLGLWVPDLFMKRVENDEPWSLFCPHEAPGLMDVWGKDFDTLYERYEAMEGRARKVLPARELWQKILESQAETGTPYMLFKDSCNAKSNQQHLGTIHCSNLCTEIVEYSSTDEVAVCNLASVALNRFVEYKPASASSSANPTQSKETEVEDFPSSQEKKTSGITKTDSVGVPDIKRLDRMSDDSQFSKRIPFYNFKKLYEVVYHVCVSLNKVIDINYYALDCTKLSNIKHRPIGIGVQGLADAFLLMDFAFSSPEAAKLNVDIFECMYFAALTASKDLAKIHGPHESYKGSPMSKGILQFDMWENIPKVTDKNWNWTALRAEIALHGVRNSLLIAPMPTASTAQIMGNNECFEPYTSNQYTRKTNAGSFTCVSKHLINDMIALGKWTPQMRQRLAHADGSIRKFYDIPKKYREKHKTAFEIPGSVLVDMAAARAPFIDQSQSLNIFMPEASFAKISSLHFRAWKRRLKTGMYYLRTLGASDAIKFVVNTQMVESANLSALESALEKLPDNFECKFKTIPDKIRVSNIGYLDKIVEITLTEDQLSLTCPFRVDEIFMRPSSTVSSSGKASRWTWKDFRSCDISESFVPDESGNYRYAWKPVAGELEYAFLYNVSSSSSSPSTTLTNTKTTTATTTKITDASVIGNEDTATSKQVNTEDVSAIERADGTDEQPQKAVTEEQKMEKTESPSGDGSDVGFVLKRKTDQYSYVNPTARDMELIVESLKTKTFSAGVGTRHVLRFDSVPGQDDLKLSSDGSYMAYAVLTDSHLALTTRHRILNPRMGLLGDNIYNRCDAFESFVVDAKGQYNYMWNSMNNRSITSTNLRYVIAYDSYEPSKEPSEVNVNKETEAAPSSSSSSSQGDGSEFAQAKACPRRRPGAEDNEPCEACSS